MQSLQNLCLTALNQKNVLHSLSPYYAILFESIIKDLTRPNYVYLDVDERQRFAFGAYT